MSTSRKLRGSYSFGACETCRRRHVKCDKVRPHCLTCRAIGVACDGFKDPGLRWVTGSESTSTKSKSSPQTVRRRFYPEKSQVSMSKELRSALLDKTLDESISNLEARSRDFTPSDEVVTVGPFGVFGAGKPLLEPPAGPSVDTDVINPGDPYLNSGDDGVPVREVNDESRNTQPLLDLDSWPDTDNFLNWSDLFDLDSSFSWLPPEAMTENSAPDQWPPIAPAKDPRSWSDLHLSDVGSSTQHSGASPNPVFSDHISVEDAQSLLKHFNDCMIQHIWSLPLGQKSSMDIHIEAAISALARLTFIATRSVSRASIAHLYGVLGLSALHFSHGKEAETAEHWWNLGERLITKARENLQYSLRHEVSPKAAKYKDLLLAISSMIAYAVLYDRQHDTRFYLLETEKLLRTCGLAKRHISRKASYLHHTYTWSRIVGESTYVLRKYDRPETKQQTWAHDPLSAFPLDTSANRQPYSNPRLDDFLGLEPSGPDDTDAISPKDVDSPLDDIHLQDSRGNSDSALRFLYGVSETWLSLVSQTTRLANFMERLSLSEERFDASLLSALETRKKRLENLIWTLAATIPPQAQDPSPRAHLVAALSHALVIFFYRRIRDVNPSILQQHVDNVIQSLQEFDAACEREGIEGPGSPWPAFMAGCEAMGPEKREYLAGWLQRSFEKTGFTRFKTVLGCVHEVWRRQGEALRTGDQGWTWVHVSKDQNMYVALC
ncbi:hypothetical protein ACJ41O_006691 [Fusarium nematophilum]